MIDGHENRRVARPMSGSGADFTDLWPTLISTLRSFFLVWNEGEAHFMAIL